MGGRGSRPPPGWIRFALAMTVLRNELLAGTRIALAGEDRDAIRGSLSAAGAVVLSLDPGFDELAAEEWARASAPLRGLVCDLGHAFAGGGEGALGAALEQCWAAVRAVAVGALIPAQQSAKLVLIGPAPDAGAHAEAARSGLENLARTVSVEWARHAITATAVMPGMTSTNEQLAELVCYLLSFAGDYLSGCRLDLGPGLRGDRR